VKRRLALSIVVAAAGFAAASCGGKVQAKTPGPVPSLATPEPPTRLVLPVSIETPTPSPVPNPPAPPTSRPATTRPTPTPAATPSPTPIPPATVENPPVLQTSANLADLESKAQIQLDKANREMKRVPPRSSLGKDAQDQFDSATSYLRRATDAMTVKNFVYAAFCAEKAATLAAGLVKKG
jgi:hypothetical protein